MALYLKHKPQIGSVRALAQWRSPASFPEQQAFGAHIIAISQLVSCLDKDKAQALLEQIKAQDFLLFTSVYALEALYNAAGNAFYHALKGKVIFCVGARAKAWLISQAKSFEQDIVCAQSAHQLAVLLKQSELCEGLYLCADNVSFDFKRALADKKITQKVIYESRANPAAIEELFAALAGQNLDRLLLWSSQTARSFFDAIEHSEQPQHKPHQIFAHTNCIAISNAVASQIPKAYTIKTVIAQRADWAGMRAALEEQGRA